MRRFTSCWLVAGLCAPLGLGCSDDGGIQDPTTTPTQPTLPPGSDTDVIGTTGVNPTEPIPTTGDTQASGNSDATDSGTTGNSGPSTDTMTTNPDPSATDSATDSDSDSATDSDSDSDTDTTDPPACTDRDCGAGEYCNKDTGECTVGCDSDDKCNNPLVCDLEKNLCTGCVSDANCELGTVCSDGECVPGCNDQQPCQGGLACCDGACFDLLSDPDHCGGCDACAMPNNGEAVCVDGVCGLGACAPGFNNCDNNPNNGCEVNGMCQCVPGEKVACYTGPDNTQGKGICTAGEQTCNNQGTGYGPCEGEVLPQPIDVCNNGIDDNCNGVVDEDPDADGDGWTVCNGDCCDAIGPNCLNPSLVNPGAFEFLGNNVDDDCDGMVDNAVPACNAGLATNSNVANDYAKAIDLCQFTIENPPLPQKKWGVISSNLHRGNGAGVPNANSRSIRDGFGTGGIVPQQSTRLAVFSTGAAADLTDVNPGYIDFQPGWDNATNSAAPNDWLTSNGGQFPNAPGCPGAGSNQAFNSIMLKVRVRVPTNAQSFSVKMYFLSAEWPEWTCTPYNDMFVALLDSAGAGNPADKNIAIYTVGNQSYPVGVNLVKAAPGLFTQCKNGTFGCSGVNGGNYNGCVGINQLNGTGMNILEGGCGTNNTTGGGTGWLTMSGNVAPGETMEIRFAIWDTADGIYDSLVLLDDWRWSVQASQPGVQPN